MQKNSAILLIACLLPGAVAAETQPVAKWVDPAPAVTATTDPVAPPALPFGVEAEKHFFPLSKVMVRPAGLQARQPFVEKKSGGLPLPAVAAHASPAPPAMGAPVVEGDAQQAKMIHDLFDAE